MQMEIQVQELYQEIAETVNNMIPGKWEKFHKMQLVVSKTHKVNHLGGNKLWEMLSDE
ncbi:MULTISPECIES: immunity protein YezG family protein [Priestia]|uniref:immunity protein YezG family protein n=1 Tax=Priestia TaxID=2800373 RepID=UPI002E1F304F|nr:DUF600 family protein [Priestia aryabhattai]